MAFKRKIMKHIIFTNTFLLLLTATVHAAPVSVGNINDIYIANTLLGSSSSAACETTQNQTNCDFLKTGPTTYLDDDGLEAIVTADPSTYVLSPFRETASFDLGFNGYNIFTGVGNDLVVFIVGNSTSFGLDVFDTQGGIIGSETRSVNTSDTVFDNDGNWLCVNGTDDICTDGAALSALFFDLNDEGTEIGSIRISLGESFNGTDGTRPRFSLAGGFHDTSIAAVPLPLPAILFGSGLGLLGLIGRRRKSQA